MVQVTIGNNISREKILVDPNTKVKKILEDNNVDYTRGIMNLDGSPLKAGDLEKTLADFGVTESCFLLNVVKADNA